MKAGQWATWLLGVTVALYWICVGVMIVRVSRKLRRAHRVLVPSLPIERVMWVVWIPLVGAWIAMPFLAANQSQMRHPWVAVPGWSAWPGFDGLRLAAAALAAGCLLLSLRCWRHMGRNWRMGIDPAQTRVLFLDGPFSRIRHPIYALSMALMLCSLVVIPTPVMAAIAIVHIILMLIKARREEEFLSGVHGEVYTEYCGRTGRFLPRLRSLRRRDSTLTGPSHAIDRAGTVA